MIEQQSKDYARNEYDPSEQSGGSSAWILILLGIIFLPAVVVSLAYAALLRYGRLRFSVIFIIAAIIDGAAIFFLKASNVFTEIGRAFKNISTIGENWQTFITPLLLINLIIGSIIGLAYCVWAVRQMVANPWKLSVPGSWMYQFKYRKTPWQALKRKKNAKKLKEGSLSSKGKAALGIDEDSGDDGVVYRYDGEAIKHTLITGLPGSGKALHKDTLIPTTRGFRTVEELQPGEIGFDERGRETTFINKFQPLTPDHYELTINGTKIKACGDHLWEVELLRESEKYGAHQTFFFGYESLERLQEWIDNYRPGDLCTTKDLDAIGIGSSLVRNKLLESIEKRFTRGTTITKAEIIKTLEITQEKVFLKKDGIKEDVIKQAERLPEEITTTTLGVKEHEILKFLPNRFKGMNVLSSSRDNYYDKKEVAETFISEQNRRVYQNCRLDSRIPNERPVRVISTRELFEAIEEQSEKRPIFAVKVPEAVRYNEKDLPIAPYTLGAWIGDGTSRAGEIGGVDIEVAVAITNSGESFTTNTSVLESGKTYYTWKIENLKKRLDSLGLIQKTTEEGSQKDIPECYLTGSVEQRISLIKGLMDTDGSVDKDGLCFFGVTNERVVIKAHQICESLGWKTGKILSKIPYAKLKDGSRTPGKRVYSFGFYPDQNIFNIKRKFLRLQDRLENRNLEQQIRHKRLYIEEIEKIEDNAEDYYCFTVDSPKSLFLCTEDYIPTHNSISMMSMMKSDIEEGKSIVGVDFKRDPELASKLATWAKENGRNFYHFVNGEAQLYDIANSPGQALYSPLASGTPTSKADMLLSMREYDTASAVYKAAMTQVLQVVFNMEYYVTLYKRRQNIPSIDWESGGFYTLVSIFTGNNLNELADQCVGTPIQDEAIALAQAVSGRTQESHAADELRGQLRTITASEYGPWMRLNRSGRNIDLFELTKEPGNVVLFSLNSDSEPEFAKYMGAIILSDLTSVSAKRRNEDLHNQVHVYVDEFQIVNPDSIKGLLEKSRASSMGITLAQQSLEQIVSSSTTNGEAYLGSVLDTCGNFIIHFGATEPSAIRMSEILGKDDFETYSASVKNESFFGRLNWANRRNQRIMMGTEERWIYEPLRFMQLDSPSPKNGFKSTAVIINKTSMDKKFKGAAGAKARKVWMIPDNRVLQKYYTRDTSKKFVAPEIKDTPLDNAIKRLEDKAPVNSGFNTSFSDLSRGRPIKSPTRTPQAPLQQANIFVETLEDPGPILTTTPPAKPTPRPSPAARLNATAPQKQSQTSQHNEKRPAPNFNNFGAKRNSAKDSRQNQPIRRPPISSFEKAYADITDNEELPSIE